MGDYLSIEARCAHYGSKIVRNKGTPDKAKKLETTVRNALGVLREDGVFAFYLYLHYRWGEGGEIIWKQVEALWQDESFGPLLPKDGEERDRLIELTDDLEALLLARRVAGQALVYALYGLRAEREGASDNDVLEGV